jgi:Taurine catabolism dioxygenase TauD, TfdA family
MEPTRDRDYFLMTANTEQRQAIWYVTGLAEVLAGPGSQDQSDDAIVQFDRYRHTRPPDPLNASLNTLSRTARRRLDQWGYVVIDDVENVTAARELVAAVGELIDGRSYSHGTKTISAHTEAPGWHPSPAYLALFCHRQRRRGAGHIDLFDVRKLVGALDADELALMTDAELHFPGPDGGVHTTMLSTDADGNTVTRFSYDLLTAADDDPLGEAGRRLAHRINDVFRELRTSVVIPDGSLLVWDNQRMLHARQEHHDRTCRLTEFWGTDWRRA